MKQLVTITFLSMTISLGAPPILAQDTSATELTPNDWLLSAPDDTERYKLLQRYLRGFDQPMWEIGERYVMVYDALQKENLDLASYHWKKIKATLQNGYLKRPKRQANADAIFLDQTWGEVQQAFESGDPAAAWEAFDLGRAACMSCHLAEDVGYMNDQSLFTDTEVP